MDTTAIKEELEKKVEKNISGVPAPKSNTPEKIERPEPWLKGEDKGGVPGSPNEDIDIFLPEPRMLKAANGEEFVVRQLTWGIEAKILSRVGAIIGRVINKDGRMPTIDQMMTILNDAPDALTDLVTYLTGKDKKWVENNLTGEIVMEVVVPFFVKNFPRWKKIIMRFSGEIAGEITQV